MKTFKKIFALQLMLLMLILLASCKGDNSQSSFTKSDIYKNWPKSGVVYCYGENFSSMARLDGNTSLSSEDLKNLVSGKIDTENSTDPTNSDSPSFYIYEGEKADSSKKIRIVRWCDTESISLINKIIRSEDIFVKDNSEPIKDDVSNSYASFTFELLNKDENGEKVDSNVFTLYLLSEEE
ncbi:MAG: hypothetical protein ACI4QE_03795 [Acutalibacteraceae bacterium]